VVSCGPSEADPSLEAITVIGRPSVGRDGDIGSFFTFEGILRDLSPGTTVTLPHDYQTDEPSGALLFVVDAETENEASSREEASSGSFVVEHASCAPVAELEVRIDATLGSEFSDLGPLQVKGTLAVVAEGDPTPTAEPTGPTAEPTGPTGSTRVDIDFENLPAGDLPAVPYVEGRTVVVGDDRFDVGADGDIVAAAAFDGGAHVVVSQEGVQELVRVTPEGTEPLGAAVGMPIASRDLRWNAYAIGEPNGDGIRLWVYDSSDGSAASVRLPDANALTMLRLADGTVYFSPEGRERGSRPLAWWSPSEAGPPGVGGPSNPTAMSADGSRVASLESVGDFGSCSAVVDYRNDWDGWGTCEDTIIGFSPGGEYAWAGPAYLDGYSIGDLAILDAQTGDVIRRLRSLDIEVDFMDAVFEDSDHLLLRAEHYGETALVRCTVSTGECEAATPPAFGTTLDGSPYLLTEL